MADDLVIGQPRRFSRVHDLTRSNAEGRPAMITIDDVNEPDGFTLRDVGNTRVGAYN